MEQLDEVLLEGTGPQLITLVHGWPDDLHLWDALVRDLLSTGKYRTLRVTLPGFGTKKRKQIVDPNFHQVADLVASAVQHHQTHPAETSILIVHDWGSVVGFNLQRNYNHLFSKMIVMDVGPTDLPGVGGLRGGVGVVAMGVYYQWLNSLAYWLWRYFPFIGEAVGDAIHHYQVRRFKQFPDGTAHPRANLSQSASAAYFYHYFQLNFWLDSFFPVSLRGGSPLAPAPADPLANPSVPTLFLYGSHRNSLGKTFKSWSNALKKREDSDVVVLKGDHWFMLWSPEETSSAVLKWLELGKDGGKLGDKFKARLLPTAKSKL